MSDQPIGPEPNQQAINYYKKRAKHDASMKHKYIPNPNPGRYKYKYKYRKESTSGRRYWIYLYYTPFKAYRKGARRKLKQAKRKYRGKVTKYKNKYRNLKRVRKKATTKWLSNLSPAQKTKLRRLLGVKKRPKKSTKSKKAKPKRKIVKKTTKKRKRNKNRKVKKKPAKVPRKKVNYDSDATVTDVENLPISLRKKSIKASKKAKNRISRLASAPKKKKLASKKKGRVG